MKHLYLFIFLAFASTKLLGQNLIQVMDAKTGRGIEGVVLLSEKYSTQTDAEGKANIITFELTDKIIIKHSSYLDVITTRKKIEHQGRIVLLVENPIRLEEIIISINRWEETKTELPHAIKTINKEDVIHFNPQNAADVLNAKGGVFIQKSQMGGGSPMIRGFAANRVLIVVDGIRMNNAIYRSGNLHNIISIDPQSLKSTEVIFGPGSVIYGSDALGGVISFNTLSPKLSTSRETELFGRLYSRYSSANFEKTLHASYNWGGKKWASIWTITYTNFDDLQMGKHGPDDYLRPQYVSNSPYTGKDKVVVTKNSRKQKYSGYSQINMLGKMRYRPNEKTDLVLNIQHSKTSDIPRYDRLILYNNKQPKYARWYYGPQKWTLFSGNIKYNKKCLLFNKVNLLLAYQNYAESRHDRKRDKNILRNREEELNIFSGNIDFAKTLTKKSELFYGIESYLNKVNSLGYSKDLLNEKIASIASRYPNHSKYSSLAAYYSFKYNMSKELIFQIGSRFTLTHLQGKFNKQLYAFPFDEFDMSNSAFNGNLGIVWHPTPNWQINLHASTGFRSPNIDDVAKVFDSEPGNIMVPNPDLKPEYARNLELSILRSYNKKVKIELTPFYTQLKNAMIRQAYNGLGQDSIRYDGELSKVEALSNSAAANIYGVNVTLEYLFNKQWRTRHDLTLTSGKDSNDSPLRHVPPTFGSSHLIYENTKCYVNLYANYNGQISSHNLSPDEQAKPHLYLSDENGKPFSPRWWTLNLKANYKLNHRITISGGVENILNKRYRTYSSGIVAPGINIVSSVSIQL